MSSAAVSVVAVLALAGVGASVASAAGPGRAYEMVSPVEKGGASVRGDRPGEFPFESFAGGNAFVYPTQSLFPGAESGPLMSMMLAKRSPDGWSSIPVDPPATAPQPGGTTFMATLGISEDQTHSFVYSWRKLTPQATEDQGNYYVKDLETGSYEYVGTSPEALAVWGNEAANYILGGTSDFSVIEFVVPGKLTPEAIGDTNAYVWTRGQGVALTSILPDGSPAPGRAAINTYFTEGRHQVSADGRRMFVGALLGGPETEGLFVYEGGHTTPISTTAHIENEPVVTVPAQFVSATADGNRVLFAVTGSQPLTPDAPVDVGNLYMADLEAGTLTLVGASAYFGVNAVTDDLSTIVYTVQGTGITHVWRNGSTQTVGVVAAPEAALSPNGRFYAFASNARLTSYDNTAGPACEFGCAEIYVYDTADGSLVCASCRADGEPANGSAEIARQGGNVLLNRHRASVVTDDGRTFFDSPDPLLPVDSNGIRDAYEYMAGEQRLISTGTGDTPSTFVEASPDGSDVFFVTAQRLVAQDQDNAPDVYDARLGGGIPSQNQRPEVTECELEQCGSLSVAPPIAGAASEAVRASAPPKKSGKPKHPKKKHAKRNKKGRKHRAHHGHKGRNGR